MLKAIISTALFTASLAKRDKNEQNNGNPTTCCTLECGEDERLDKELCACEAKHFICDITCDSGFKQDKKTCECYDYTQYAIDCESGFEENLEECLCATEDQTYDWDCDDEFELADDGTCSCIYTGDLCEPIKCVRGQGWDVDYCKCDFYADCSGEPDCEVDGYKHDKMTCECVLSDSDSGSDSESDSDEEEEIIPIDPIDPVDPIDPTDPIDPVDPIDPEDPLTTTDSDRPVFNP
jgi:hypothetical protein